MEKNAAGCGSSHTNSDADPARWILLTYFEPLARAHDGSRIECRGLVLTRADVWRAMQDDLRGSLPGEFVGSSASGSATLRYSGTSEYLARFTERQITPELAGELAGILGENVVLGEILQPAGLPVGFSRALPPRGSNRVRRDPNGWLMVVNRTTAAGVAFGSLTIVPNRTWDAYVAHARKHLDGSRVQGFVRIPGMQIIALGPSGARAAFVDVESWLATFSARGISDQLALAFLTAFGTNVPASDPGSHVVRWVRFARVGTAFEPRSMSAVLERHAPRVTQPECWKRNGPMDACPLHELDPEQRRVSRAARDPRTDPSLARLLRIQNAPAGSWAARQLRKLRAVLKLGTS